MNKAFLIICFGFIIGNCYSQESFTNDIAFFAYLKITNTPLTLQESEKFINRYYRKEMNQNASDEFEYKAYINKKHKDLLKQFDTIDLKKTYMYGDMLQLGEYNFEKEGFPVLYDYNFSQGNINPQDGYSGYDFIAKAQNINDYRFLPMNQDSAKKLIDQLKVNGNDSRQLLTLVYITLNGQTDKYTEGITDSFTGYTLCTINKMRIQVKNMGMIEFKK